LPPEPKRELIEPAHPQLSIARQCDLVGLPRSTYDDHAQGESAEHLALRHVLHRPYPDTPYYGVRRMTAWWRSQGDAVHHKRVARRLRTRGLETLYPQPRPREPPPAQRVYPYWLRGVPSTRVHQVWSTDIT
jgi:putative transposase